MWLLLVSLAWGSPWVGARASVRSGFPDAYGLQIGYTSAGWWSAEAGASWVGFARSAHLRAGVPLRIVDRPRWTVQLAPRLGWRVVHSTPHDRRDLFHGPGADVALDAARWWGHLGVTAQAQAGGTVWIARTNPHAQPWMPEMRLSFGVSWRP